MNDIKVSIIIPVHKTEEIGYITRTLDGIVRTIGIPAEQYSITLVGTTPQGTFSSKTKAKYNFLPTDALLGNAKNQGAKYAMAQYNPDVLVFMDAHMNFFDDKSANWGQVIYDFIKSHPNTVASPAISIYDKPYQRGFGVITDVKVTNDTADLAWRWVGSPDIRSPDSPIEVPGLCGCFMAMMPSVFKKSIFGFTPPLAIDDREFSLRIWTLGVDLYALPNITVGHRFTQGYSDFSKDRSISWGAGYLLFSYLNMPEQYMSLVYKNGIGSSSDKLESLRMVSTQYWKQMKQELVSKRVRTYNDYYSKYNKLLK